MVDSYADLMLVPFAKYLSKYAKAWKLSDLGASLMIPKNHYSFNSILFKQKKLSYSTDRTWEFVASVIIINKEDFSKEDKAIYQVLKGFECDIKRTGLIRKKYLFISNPLLTHLNAEIPELHIDPYLVKRFNQDYKLKKFSSEINPDQILIRLFSQPIDSKELIDYCRIYKKIFNNPTDGIIWNIVIEKYLGSIILKKTYLKVLDSIIESFNIISRHLIEISNLKLRGF
ncbi:MAG: hypothetical protein ACXAC7_07920 [Candidatus Hodarchaeales archaeon]|jgi:hypothetical protein